MIASILKNDICLGCGLCEAVGVEYGCKMKLNDKGFYIPENFEEKELNEKIGKICPAINVKVPKSKRVWGNIVNSFEGSSTDDEVVYNSSSGGSVSGLSIYLLENKIVSGVLHVGSIADHYMHNKLFLSKSKGDILKRSSSRYAPALIFDEIFNFFEKNSGEFAFIGKPCDISGLSNLLNEYPQYKNRIKLTIAIFCAGMPSYNATNMLIEKSNEDSEPLSVRYRGEGWPGNFVTKFKNEKEYKLTYNESWGGELHKNLNFRCKICPDGIGLSADISVGDAWETEDGYPNFEEKKGRSLILARTELGNSIINAAQNAKYIEINEIQEERLKSMQPYQYERQFFVGYRLIVFQLFSKFMLNFKGIPILKLMLKYPLKKGLIQSRGSLKRLITK